MAQRLWLASASPRRMTSLGQKFPDLEVEQHPLVGHKESINSTISVNEQVRDICHSKAYAAISRWPEDVQEMIALVSDTLVADPDDVHLALGQPDDEISALAMLSRLSGRIHAVWSATALIVPEDFSIDSNFDRESELLVEPGFRAWIWVERALVEIEELDAHALDDLIHSGSWKGKAGGYDMAGAMREYTRLMDGHEIVVLGFAEAAMSAIQEIIGARPRE
ncbi:MAG: Maf family protein [Candidatus Poseidoniaceae archaeon]|jgi:septum formation protein|nr:Maf family protein [Candidatus Poseidoniaceae archaeon]MDP7202803.1 Maf family protein [Candidatus Poseidoniaceae archaeon]|tara:strand:- start:405 stop:1070 length:666 start_codon:yes stop_codon:yes gene_type:complete